MHIFFSKKKIVILLLYFFLFVCVFFPRDILYLKLTSFISLLILNINLILNKLKKPKYNMVLLISIIFPIGTILHSCLLGSDFFTALLSGYTGALFLLYIIIKELNIKYENMIIQPLKALAFLTIALALFDFFHMYSTFMVIQSTFNEIGSGYIGISPAYAVYYKLFFKTSPLLLILLFHSLEHKKWKYVIVSILALILSGTRGNIFAMCMLLSILFFLYKAKNRKEHIYKLLTITILFLFSIYLVPNMYTIYKNMMTTSGSLESDQVRSGQIKGILKLVKNEPEKLILGSGYGNVLIFDYGRNSHTKEFELAYFALLAKIGVFWFIIFLIFIFTPMYKLIVKKRYSVATLHFCYLLEAFTNPLLVSSTAFLMYIFVYDHC